MKTYKCELCDNAANKSSIIGEIYYQHLCLACYDSLVSMEGESSGAAAYNRSRDLEEHEADIRQPYNDGKPDAEFLKLYPETAHKMWSADEIQQAERA